MKLKIFSDQSFLPDQCEHLSLKYVPMLFPFWGKTSEDPEDFRSGRFDDYLESGQSFLEMTDLAKADLAVFPAYWHLTQKDDVALNRGIQFLEMAKQAGKPAAIFATGDWTQDVPVDNTLAFFTSSFQSRRKPNEFAMPEWNVDFIKTEFDGQIPVRQKQVKPTVGFCGYAPPLGLPFGVKKLKALLRMGSDLTGFSSRISYRSGHTIRVRALNALTKSPLITTNFIFRDQFAFTSKGLQGVSLDRKEHARQLRSEFCQNLVNSDYVLCASGYENYSIRFYEALSCGRIPVLIDTDCVLPYDFAIDWKRYCVRINEHELSSIAEKVADFHDRLSAQEFIDLQHECRNLYQQWLSPEGFFANLHQCIKKANVPLPKPTKS